MSIPIAPTTINVLRDLTPEDDLEYDTGTTTTSKLVTISRNVRAAIGSPSSVAASETMAAGTEQLQMNLSMACDPCDITHRDFVSDNKTGIVYNVLWVIPRDELGITYMQVGLRIHQGTMSGSL